MIYDILLNFKTCAYEFYEWEKNDNIIHVKSIESFKVKDKVLKDFIENEVVVDKSFLDKIKNKTEIYNKNKLIHACILYNNESAYAFLFDINGKIIGRSKMLFDEEYDVTNLYSKSDYELINYKVNNKINNKKYITRKEDLCINILKKYINDLYKNKKYDEIKYIYFECFNIKEENNNLIYTKLLEKIENNDIDVIKNIFNILKVYKK